MGKPVQDRGIRAFDQYYAEIFGSEWAGLRRALLVEGQKVDVSFLGESPPYSLDPASRWVAEQLEVRTDHKVLDMCASPGGKSLILIKATQGQAEYHLNDLSVARVERLKRVLGDHLPPSVLKPIKITRGDAGRLGLKYPGHFDRILLDAPCSGERHLLQSEKHMAEWTSSRSKHLARRQYTLLCSAALCLKPGGRLVYSTCTLNPVENEKVIERFMKKKPGVLAWVNSPGQCFRPDKNEGWGPMYCAVLERADG